MAETLQGAELEVVKKVMLDWKAIIVTMGELGMSEG